MLIFTEHLHYLLVILSVLSQHCGGIFMAGMGKVHLLKLEQYFNNTLTG